MESTMCHDDGVDFSAAASPSPILHLFTAYYKKNVASLFFFPQQRAGYCIYWCSRVRPGGCVAVCLVALYSRIPPTRPLRLLQLPLLAVSSSPLSHRLPQIPIGDGSALEFIPHHPAELWPSNSQPLWPRQMNNKTRALRLISGKKEGEKEWRLLGARLSSENPFLSSEVKDLRNTFSFIYFFFFSWNLWLHIRLTGNA